MPTRWETFPVELSGGLVSNMSRLQQGAKQPGSARVLQNFEPSVKGGYRRINGFTKYDPEIVPPYGSTLVQGSGQTGTSLVIGNIHESPSTGDILVVDGVRVPPRNLLTYTEQLENAAWLKFGTAVVANAAIAPDGTLTAERITTDGTSDANRVEQTISCLPNTDYVFSVWVKAVATGINNLSRINLRATGGTTVEVSQRFEATGDWQRIESTINTGNNNTLFSRAVREFGGSTDVFEWGAQLELGPTATDYQKVVASGEVTEDGSLLPLEEYSVTAVSFSETNKEATLTLDSALSSSPDDKAEVTFTSGSSRIEGVFYSAGQDRAFALRGGGIWSSTGAGWTQVNTESYGTTLVNGAGQTGTGLILDGFASDTYLPKVGDTFTLSGVEKAYTIATIVGSAGGNVTLTISPALASSPADNAVVTFLASTHVGGTKARFVEFNFDGTFKVALVDGSNEPTIISSIGYSRVKGVSELVGATFVEEFKDHLFFAKGDLISFSAPFEETNFTPADGAGSYRLPNVCTGLITFRDQLINFSETAIRRLQGSSVSDFTLTSIANSFGCISGDTVQEVGGDIMFLGPDGIRFLGATERIGDFNLSLASRQVQTNFTSFIDSLSDYTTCVVREKNQYRIFKYREGTMKRDSEGYIGSQFLDQNAQSINWSQTKGIKAYRSSSTYSGEDEIVLFSNEDEYVYRMESGNDFDGTSIQAFFYTPFMSVNDPSIRKTAYKVDTYFDPEGVVEGSLALRYDFDKPSKIQPNSVSVDGGGGFSTWGSFVWGEDSWGGTPETLIQSQVTGSFFTISLQYEFEGGAPFVLDTLLIEYSTEDRK